MKIEELKERKRELGYSNRELAELSGVALGTVQKVFGGATASPRRSTLESLEKVLAEPSIAAESPAPYGAPAGMTGRRGGCTIEDYRALPEDVRAELIDGTLYFMATPTSTHQALVTRLSQKLQAHIDRNHGSCMCFVSPFSVQLDRDDRTMLEPDVSVICSRDRIRRFGCYGAPDYVAEVLSPSTKMKDMVIKLAKFYGAGVREAWFIDPDRRQIAAYHDLQHESVPQIYSFQDEVPVGIWNRECKVDFAEIDEQIRFLYELPEE